MEYIAKILTREIRNQGWLSATPYTPTNIFCKMKHSAMAKLGIKTVSAMPYTPTMFPTWLLSALETPGMPFVFPSPAMRSVPTPPSRVPPTTTSKAMPMAIPKPRSAPSPTRAQAPVPLTPWIQHTTPVGYECQYSRGYLMRTLTLTLPILSKTSLRVNHERNDNS